jgi:hypothetical protein
MTSERGKLTLVTGSPRSSTTAFHNALIASGLYGGVLGDDMLDRDPNLDRKLYTDEYYPSMQIAIAGSFSSSPLDRTRLRQQLVAQIDSLHQAFGSANGLMLKAPHYVFGIPAYVGAYGSALRLIFIHRSPLAIAASMLKHPHISRQLPGAIGQCTDFTHFELLRTYAAQDVLTFAASRWDALSLFERALFVWYLYANAFLRNVATGDCRFLVVRNESFDHQTALKIVRFLDIAAEEAAGIEARYRVLPAAATPASSLSSEGQRLWELIQPADAELTARS